MFIFKKNIYIVLRDIFKFYIVIFFSKFKLKKYKAFSKYAIVSAVYNVEKYLDDYFNSIINQRLDFRNNIFIILVDDGSNDNSANIIKKYQKKYPKNIIYLYKENGGQASARNLGLKYMQENNYNVDWVTFTDPDDFLDRNYFYEVDKFLTSYQNEDICMIGCNLIFYYEKQRLYKDTHPLNFKFKNKIIIKDNSNLDDFIQLSAASCFLNINYLNNLLFDEKLKPNFEDAKFINEYLLKNINLKSAFLRKSIYFYRKRKDENSTLNTKYKNKSHYTVVPKLGYLELLKGIKGVIPDFIQNVVLYDIYWYIKELLNSNEKLSILSQEEIQEFKKDLFEIFKYIDCSLILKHKNKPFDFKIIQGILYYFKHECFYIDTAFIESIDDKNNEILIKYYFTKTQPKEEIFIDKVKIETKYSKIKQYDLIDNVFLYEKRIWIEINMDVKNLDIYIDFKKMNLVFKDNKIQCLEKVLNTLKKQKKQRLKNSDFWLFADMSFRADDNAEHLYRYVMKNYPEKNIAFVLRKNSHDYKRLKKEGFRLVDPKSFKFKYLVFKADKLISSHLDKYFIQALGKNTLKTKDFVFLQHGITQNDLSSWLNQRKIDLFITGIETEYDSIVGDFNRYKFTPKEVKLTGFPRWDALFKNNKTNTRQILIMPTWREYIVGAYSKKLMKRRFNPKFYESEYFYKWSSFLHSKKLQELCEQYNYKIVFNPHPQIRPYLEGFNLPNYILIPSVEMSMQKLFCESSLMITDYSSVAFEMAVLKKPVIYYQFDKEDFFKKHLKKGYFNFEKDGFGNVVLDMNDLLSELKMKLQNYGFKNNFSISKVNFSEKTIQAILSI